jgi:glycine/D-amino acid oxidase-like deaminating enzyme
MKVDFLIVGHGLAGGVLSFMLRKHGRSIKVIDHPEGNHSSVVAAGLYNPITGRQMVKTWKADLLFPYLEQFYEHAEKALGAKFLHKVPIYRPFFSIEEQNEWMGRMADPGYENVIAEVRTSPLPGADFHDPFGGLLLKKSGYMDIPAFLEAHLSQLRADDAYSSEVFDETALIVGENSVIYKGLRADKLIYANGLEASKSRYFGELPFHPLKGEILDIETNLPDEELILNRGVFVFKNAGGRVRCGSTYNWREINLLPTENGRNEIEQKLRLIYGRSFQTLKQLVGIRPSTADRRPLLGIHPIFKPLGIFNGLGTKGVSLAPFFANMLVEHILFGKSLLKEVDIRRYLSKLSSRNEA